MSLRQATSYFLRQTYPEKEFVVVAADSRAFSDLPDDPRIKLVLTPATATPRERWASALQQTVGRYITRWDPADWIGPDRLSVQVAALARRSGSICLPETVMAFNPRLARAWRCRETRPAAIARKTWCCERDRLAAAFADAADGTSAQQVDDPIGTFAGAAVERVDSPWYVWVFSGTAAPSSSRDLLVEPVATGEAVRTLSQDLDAFVGLRASPASKKTSVVPRKVPRSPSRPDDGWTAAKLDVTESHPRQPAYPRGRVSCLMPTFGRASFLAHAIDCFLAQDYPNRELVIVDDSPESAEGIVAAHKDITYIRMRPRRSIGTKRNLAAEAATGDYLMCWDDDDWSGPGRISHQLSPLLAGVRDVTAITTGYIFVQPSRQFWRQKPGRSGVLFHQGVNWGTLAWSRAAQSGGIRFPDSSLAEDVAFKDSLVRHGARLQILDNPGVYVYVRHGANTWNFPEHKMLVDDQWLRMATPDFFPVSARAFYGVAS
jgi:hypothetical protein